ncbi:hypothetical protein [Natrinema salifodinae]|uniref:Uncharacterized protein n=2 Tax=Halobacteriales TaxID=2235 RepID=A0A1I0R0D7_9EURY|nr:hypothetical protein [Natrinema salifodinae]SEW32918.1 hypothetical protein SAMN05216285_4170 [Natrinema salifodinae]
MKLKDPHRRRVLRQTGATLTAIGTAGLATTTASAQTDDDSPPGGLLASGFDVGNGSIFAFLRGFRSARQSPLAQTPSLENLADGMRNEFVANEEHWINYGNWLVSEHDEVEPLGTTTLQVDVFESTIRGEGDRVETVIEAEYDDSTEEFTAIDWRIEAPENPDYQVGIKDSHARLADDDLMEYRRKFIDESGDGNHAMPDGEYVEELKGRYWDGITIGPDSKGVLEILVGEVSSNG